MFNSNKKTQTSFSWISSDVRNCTVFDNFIANIIQGEGRIQLQTWQNRMPTNPGPSASVAMFNISFLWSSKNFQLFSPKIIRNLFSSGFVYTFTLRSYWSRVLEVAVILLEIVGNSSNCWQKITNTLVYLYENMNLNFNCPKMI